MKLDKLPYEPSDLVEFYTESLQVLGGVCERTWHDRLQVLAEGRAARLLSETEPLLEVELKFPAVSDTSPRDAASEVFPGCPLTFRLADEIRGNGLAVERVAIRFEDQLRAPVPESAARLWNAQFPSKGKYEQVRPFTQDWASSLLSLVRCEVQAIDQHWSLHRFALSWPGGDLDEDLASRLEFAQVAPHSAGISWPSTDPPKLSEAIRSALMQELAVELAPIKTRQQLYLRRELERIDSYFANYQRELQARKRGKKEQALRLEDRLAAARQEHARRRQDQVQRHEIRVIPHLDALLLLAEPCWRTGVKSGARGEETLEAVFIPRAKRWRMVMD